MILSKMLLTVIWWKLQNWLNTIIRSFWESGPTLWWYRLFDAMVFLKICRKGCGSTFFFANSNKTTVCSCMWNIEETQKFFSWRITNTQFSYVAAICIRSRFFISVWFKTQITFFEWNLIFLFCKLKTLVRLAELHLTHYLCK